MKNLFKKESKKILIYPTIERIEDPIEKNVEHILLNPIPIRALVNDLTFASAQWKLPGININKAKDILVEKRHKKLLEQSYKIQIQGEEEFYQGWKVHGRAQTRLEGDFVRLYIYTEG